jgi:ferric-dicitrate binding protein FerR (iron transport regulator)
VSTTDTMSDAWAAGTSAAHDLAASAAERAVEMASAAVDQLDDLPDTLAGLASAARSRIHPTSRRSWRPWLLLAAAGVAVVLAAMWWRRRSSTSTSPAVDIGPDDRPNPVREAARSAAGS